MDREELSTLISDVAADLSQTKEVWTAVDLADALLAAFDEAGVRLKTDRELVAIPAEVFEFLMGQGPLEGCHFGEHHPERRGLFWWRKLMDGEHSNGS